MINLDYTLEAVIQLSKKVAVFIMLEGRNFKPDKIEQKGLNDLVSYVDKTAEQKLVEGLRLILPQAGFITEEGTATDDGEEYKWIIDPLDGTTNFIHSLPVFAISIALMQGDEVILGVIYEPNREECFHAIKDGKAFCNEKPISVSPVRKLNGSLLATGFPYYHFDQLPQYLQLLDHFMRSTHGLRRMGSAAIDMAYVACGRFEGFFEYNLNAWDIAAGTLIVKQAGGKVTDFKGGNDYLFGRSMIAAGATHKEIHKVIKKYWPAV
ncbi:MAG: inositol monophosphatase family protein [Cyclobacteriaceae bacterium]